MKVFYLTTKGNIFEPKRSHDTNICFFSKRQVALQQHKPSEMRSKSKSTAKARSEQTVSESQPAGPSSSSTTNNSNPVEVIYNQFVSLGMPTDVISLTEFGRIYCPSSTTIGSSTTNLKSTKSMSKVQAKDATVNAASPLTRALDFISTHLVGRQEVRKRRALISQCVFPIFYPRLSVFEMCNNLGYLKNTPHGLRNSKHQVILTKIQQRTFGHFSIIQNKQRKHSIPVHDVPWKRYRENGM